MEQMRCRSMALSVVCFLSLLAPSASTAGPQKTKKEPPVAPDTVAGGVNGAPALDSKSYMIGPEDVLLVRVWRDPEVSGNVVVRPDGRITLQLLGEIQAAGMTPEALTQ